MELFAEVESASRSTIIRTIFKDHAAELDKYEVEDILNYCVKDIFHSNPSKIPIPSSDPVKQVSATVN